MSPGEVAAVVAAAALAIGVVGLLFALGSAIRTMAVVRHAVEDMHRQAVPLLSDVHGAVRQATAELARVDTLLETAQSVTGTVDSASRLAHRAFSNPVVKAMAIASGSTKAFRALVKRR